MHTIADTSTTRERALQAWRGLKSERNQYHHEFLGVWKELGLTGLEPAGWNEQAESCRTFGFTIDDIRLIILDAITRQQPGQLLWEMFTRCLDDATWEIEEIEGGL